MVKYTTEFYNSRRSHSDPTHRHKYECEEFYEVLGYFVEKLSEYEDSDKVRIFEDGVKVATLTKSHPSSGAVNVSFEKHSSF